MMLCSRALSAVVTYSGVLTNRLGDNLTLLTHIEKTDDTYPKGEIAMAIRWSAWIRPKPLQGLPWRPLAIGSAVPGSFPAIVGGVLASRLSSSFAGRGKR